VESSADGSATWAQIPVTLRSGRQTFTTDGSLTGYGGRRWWRVTAAVPAGTTHLRWSYRTDGSAQGRGVYLDRVRVAGARAGRFVADGWTSTNS